MEENRTIKFEDIVEVIKRRKWSLILPALAVILLTVMVLLVWKPVYRSTATILIEEQEIPREYVMATVTSFAEQRLHTINQRIMSSTRLLEIIHSFNLYADRREKVTTEEIVDDMRKKDIKFSTVTADVIDRQTGRPAAATIAFTVSYEGKNQAIVQQVANALSSLYLEENLKVVGQQTAGAAKFLEDEAKSVQSELADLDRKIALYKERNPRSLPELYQFNLQALDSSDRFYDELNAQLRSLRERESYMQTELATIKPETANQDKERLKELRSALLSLMTRYSDEYPDVIKTKAEINELEKKTQLEGSQPKSADKPDNPTYIALSAQLAGVQS
ncbi:MAG: chain-length determining protein, partial [Nitrospirae bacterium]|nr:chain-length determining protein [Nitrospirota bacterium]